MTRIDWLVLRTLAARVALTITIVFGLFSLAGSLDTSRFATLSSVGGPQLAVLAIAVSATRWVIGSLPVTILIGTIVGMLDLQARRELTVIKASGMSIWRVLRAPAIATLLFGLLIAFVADSVALNLARFVSSQDPRAGSSGELWLEQKGEEGHYVLHAMHSQATGTQLGDVTFFMVDSSQRERIQAAEVRLTPGAWVITAGTRYRPDVRPETLTGFQVTTATTAGDMQVRLTSVRDLTFLELDSALTHQVADPALRGAVLTSLLRLITLPVLLLGSVLIGAAFTSGYRRTNKYGGAVLYGIVLGFVVYVITEMANRAGFAGVLDPTFAASGPAFVAIVIGLTVLLYKEDGRA